MRPTVGQVIHGCTHSGNKLCTLVVYRFGQTGTQVANGPWKYICTTLWLIAAEPDLANMTPISLPHISQPCLSRPTTIPVSTLKHFNIYPPFLEMFVFFCVKWCQLSVDRRLQHREKYPYKMYLAYCEHTLIQCNRVKKEKSTQPGCWILAFCSSWLWDSSPCHLLFSSLRLQQPHDIWLSTSWTRVQGRERTYAAGW